VLASVRATPEARQSGLENEAFLDSRLDRLAKEHGISKTRRSPDNLEVPITDETNRKVLAALGVTENSVERPKKKQQSKRSSDPLRATLN
jgi:hypothetical protein